MLQFGQFRLDPVQQVLWLNGQLVPVGPKVVHTLAILVAKEGEVVSKDELIRQVWGDTVVEDNSVARNISMLRKLLRDTAGNDFVIETSPKRGYRFHIASPAGPATHTGHSSVRADLSPIETPGHAGTLVGQWVLPLVAVAVLASCVAVGAYLMRTTAAEKSHSRRSVAVVGFADLSQHQDSAWLTAALSEMMTSQLGVGGKLLTIPDEAIARARTELRLENRDGFSKETLARLRQNLSADFVVSGAYTVLPNLGSASDRSQPPENQIQLNLRIQDAATGESIESVSETGTQSSLFDLVARAAAKLRQDMGLEVIAPEDAERVCSSVSSNPEAVRFYAQGIEEQRNFDAQRARDLLQQAVAADPNYALAHSALAEAWMTLGYDQRAAQSAQTAYRLSAKLGLEQKLLIEGRYREAMHQWAGGVAAYRTLFNAYPDNIEYGLLLARAQRLGAQYHDALATVQALKKLPAPFSGDPRIDLEEGLIAEPSGDTASMERAASAAEQKGRERGSTLLIAQAKLLKPISDTPTFVADQKAACQLCEGLGDMDCAGQAWLRIGRARIPRPAAKTAMEQALAVFVRIGDQRKVGEVHTQLGVLAMKQGNFTEARREYTQARDVCQDTGDRGCVTEELLQDGDIDANMGDASAAERKFRQSLELARQTGEDQLIWKSSMNLATLLAVYEGKPAEAETVYRGLLDVERNGDGEQRVETILSNLGAVLTDEGHLTEARRMLTEAAERSAKNGHRFEFIDDVTLAEIDIAEGHPSAAEARLKPMVGALEEQRDVIAIGYYTTIAEAQLEQNRPNDAERSAARARELLGSTRSGYDALEVAIVEAKVAVALRPQDNAVRTKSVAQLHETRLQCQKSGLVELDFRARLAEGEIEMRTGATGAGRAHLATLEHDAASKGFGTIARQASAARQVILARGT